LRPPRFAMFKALVFAALVLAAFAADPPRPRPSENFDAQIHLAIRGNGRQFTGKGFWGRNFDTKLEAERLQFDSPGEHLNTYTIQNYPQAVEWRVFENNQTCQTQFISGGPDSVWSWVAGAQFVGKRVVLGREVDVWGLRSGLTVHELAVPLSDPNTPLELARITLQDQHVITFDNFRGTAPPDSNFAKPPQCT